MAITKEQIYAMNPGDFIIGSDGKRWEVIKNEKRGDGWRYIVLKPRGKEVCFWYRPNKQSIVHKDSLDTVEEFADEGAKLISR